MSARSALVAFAFVVGCSVDPASPAAPTTTVVSPYVAISAALAADTIDQVAANAAELDRLAGAMSDKPGMTKVAAGAKRLGGTDIDATRTAFKSVSDGMLEYMRADPSTHAGHVIGFCPMAFADKGALWVQAEGKIANPYFGASMLRCGNKLAWDAPLPETAAL